MKDLTKLSAQQAALRHNPQNEEIHANPPGGLQVAKDPADDFSEIDQRTLRSVEVSVGRHPNGGVCTFQATEYSKVLEILKARHPNLAFSYGDQAFKWNRIGSEIIA
jgi:hypothetical protein